jgi:hypothetical protein
MKPFFPVKLVAASIVAVTSLSITAAPLKRTDVPATPAWVLHIDFDGLRPTTIGQYILSEMNKPEAQEKLAAFQNLFSFDLRTQLHSVTLYGTTNAARTGVLLVYADVDPTKLVSLAKLNQDYASTNHNSHQIHSWIDDKRHSQGEKARVYAALDGNQGVIFGQQQARVAEALDVLDAITPSLASSKTFPQLGAGNGGTIVQGAARKLDLPDPNAAIFKLSKAINLQIAETQQQLAASLRLEADSEDVAQNMGAIARGLVALLKLQKDKPPSKFAEALSIKQDGASIVASLSVPAADVVEGLKSHAARKAAKESENK